MSSIRLGLMLLTVVTIGCGSDNIDVRALDGGSSHDFGRVDARDDVDGGSGHPPDASNGIDDTGEDFDGGQTSRYGDPLRGPADDSKLYDCSCPEGHFCDRYGRCHLDRRCSDEPDVCGQGYVCNPTVDACRCEGTGCRAACEVSEECVLGLVCDDGECRPGRGCTKTVYCPYPQVCSSDGKCTLASDLQHGAGCTQGWQCSSGVCAGDRCIASCSGNVDCPDGTHCAAGLCMNGEPSCECDGVCGLDCMFTCSRTADCLTGDCFVTFSPASQGYCSEEVVSECKPEEIRYPFMPTVCIDAGAERCTTDGMFRCDSPYSCVEIDPDSTTVCARPI